MLKKCYFVATLKKYHLIFIFKKLNTYIRINYLKVKKEIYLERKQASYDSWRLARSKKREKNDDTESNNGKFCPVRNRLLVWLLGRAR